MRNTAPDPNPAAPAPWSYRGTWVYPAAINGSGIRWYALGDNGYLRAGDKTSMRELIRAALAGAR